MSLPLFIKLNGTHKQVKAAYEKRNGKYREAVSICYKKSGGWDQVQAPTHTHAYTETDRVDATCTEAGIITYSCTCGIWYTDTIPATGHACGDWYQTIAPTETTEGEKRRDCQNCDYYEIETIPVTTHNHNDYEVTILEAVAATCTSTGLTEGQKCSGCGEVLVAQTVTPKLEHNWREDGGQNPSCTEDGYTGYTCDNCGAQKDEPISATGHTEVIDKAVAATCTTSGLTEGKHCSVCNTILVAQQTVAALGHSDDNKDGYCDACNTLLCDENGHIEEVIEAEAPTCTTTGLTEGKKCSVCGEILKKQETVDALGHNTEGWSANSDTHWKTCTRCLDKIDETAHDDIYIKELQFNSSDDHGYESGLPYHHYVDRWCRTCNQQVALDLEKCKTTDMWQSTEVIAPTCTTQGYTIKVCECGMAYDNSMAPAFDITPATGHNTEGVNWSCDLEGDGTHWKFCSVCNEKCDVEEHDFNSGESEVFSQPTCTAMGKTRHCCKCGDSVVLEDIPALGHTDTADPSGICDVCGSALCSEQGHISGEEWYYEKTGTNHYKLCTACGAQVDIEDHVEPDAYEYNEVCHYKKCTCGKYLIDEDHEMEVTVDLAASCTDTGLKRHYCSVEGCNYSYTEEIPALGHNEIWNTTTDTHQRICNRCNTTFSDEESHILGDWEGLSATDDWHWKECDECGYQAYYGPHSYVWDNTENKHKQVCECGKVKTEGDHAFTETVINEPTCDTNGTLKKTCSVCTYTTYEDIPALGHKPQPIGGTKDAHAVCEVCGEVTSSEHVFNTVPDTVATCEEGGKDLHSCSCGYSYKTDTEPLGHDTANVDYSYIEGVNGSHWKVCQRCGERIGIAQHDIEGVDWSYDHDTHWKICTICEAKANIAEHNPMSVDGQRVEATCAEDGYMEYNVICTVCETVLSSDRIVIPATGEHNFKWQLSDNAHWEECEQCHYKRNETDHSVVFVDAVEPACTDGHKAYYVCRDTACGMFWDADKNVVNDFEEEIKLPALGHKVTKEAVPEVAATCTSDGMARYYICDNCGKYLQWIDDDNYSEIAYEDLVIEKLPHSYEHNEYLAPTCESTGFYSHYLCRNCGKYFEWIDDDNYVEVDFDEDLKIPALGGHATVVTSDIVADTFGKGSGAYITFTIDKGERSDISSVTLIVANEYTDLYEASVDIDSDSSGWYTAEVSEIPGTYTVKIIPCCSDQETIIGTFKYNEDGSYTT